MSDGQHNIHLLIDARNKLLERIKQGGGAIEIEIRGRRARFSGVGELMKGVAELDVLIDAERNRGKGATRNRIRVVR